MQENTGVYRFIGGITRRLTPSEIRYGYLYVTNDKALGKNYTIFLNGVSMGNRKLDNHGRLGVGKANYEGLKNNEVKFSLKEKKIFIDLS
jgi:hypothetical protein